MKFSEKISIPLGICTLISIVLCAVLWFSLKANETRDSINWEENFNTTQHGESYSSNYDVTPPSWVQGEWAVTTSYGSYGIKIQGEQMWIVDFDGTMRNGTYHYDSDLHTLFPDFEDTCFELDLTNHRISAGGGYYFHRI